MLTRQGLLSPQSNNLNVVAAEETTLQTTVVAVSGKNRRRMLQCERYGNAVEAMVFSMRLPAPNCAPPTPEQEALGTGWNHVV
jgi:hypothetical protein